MFWAIFRPSSGA